MAFVNITIFENPQDISWRVVDATEPDEQFYGTLPGKYDEAKSFMQFFNMESGLWTFVLSRESLAANAVAELGTINMGTGSLEIRGRLSFPPNSISTTEAALVLLTN